MKRRLIAAVLAVSLSGCGTVLWPYPRSAHAAEKPQWVLAKPGFVPEAVRFVRYSSEEALKKACGDSNAVACYLPETRDGGTCVVLLGPKGVNHCTVQHEVAHCVGWDHYGDDSSCGPPIKIQ